MRNPTPAPAHIIVPATGAPTCRGVALTVRPLIDWYWPADGYKSHDEAVKRQADRAIRDGHVLCLRATADRPACVGISPTQFAVSSLQDDFGARALVVDPYDAEGNDIRDGLDLAEQVADVCGVCGMAEQCDDYVHQQVAAWEGSEAT